jgi:hypothetical protein
MKSKSLIAVTLLLFVAASMVHLALGDSPRRAEDPGQNSETTDPVAATPGSGSLDRVEETQHRVIAYYFHGTARCPTCRAIEQYAYEALVTGFPRELQFGVLEWHAINVEEPQNQHFIDDYELIMRSVILADMAGENQTKWKNLDRIWDLVGDKGAFISYVQEETRAYMEEN